MNALTFRKYPSTTALQCFESAARHLSFTKAGKELHMTQSAVSKQVAQLEELLGVQLFYRANQGIMLSPSGQSYYKDTLKILEQIHNATINMMVKQQEGEILKIACHPTFCSKWLVPALKNFEIQHPNIHLSIKEQSEPILDNNEIDIAFAFGDGMWIDMDSVKLFDERLVAVCRPNYLPHDIQAHKLVNYPLLQISSRPDAWHDYLAHQGYQNEQALMGARFDTFYACITGAMIGCGIALVPKRFVVGELSDGSLVKAMPFEMISQNAYYMAYQNRLAHTPKVEAMINWITCYLANQEKNS